jgi:hypothetical protein
MILVMKIIGLWVLASCTLGPCLTWAIFFMANAKEGNPEIVVYRYLIIQTACPFQFKSGLMSVPRLPQAVHAKCDSKSDSRTSSDHRSPRMIDQAAAYGPASFRQMPLPTRARNVIPPSVADEYAKGKTKNQNRIDEDVEHGAPLPNARPAEG